MNVSMGSFHLCCLLNVPLNKALSELEDNRLWINVMFPFPQSRVSGSLSSLRLYISASCFVCITLKSSGGVAGGVSIHPDPSAHSSTGGHGSEGDPENSGQSSTFQGVETAPVSSQLCKCSYTRDALN